MTPTEILLTRANEKAKAYALITTNLEHAEILLGLADTRDKEYIAKLEAHVKALKGE